MFKSTIYSPSTQQISNPTASSFEEDESESDEQPFVAISNKLIQDDDNKNRSQKKKKQDLYILHQALEENLAAIQVFPNLPEYKFILNDQFKNLIVQYNPIKDDQTFKYYDTNEKLDIINTIKFYSKYKGTEIDSYVEKKLSII